MFYHELILNSAILNLTILSISKNHYSLARHSHSASINRAIYSILSGGKGRGLGFETLLVSLYSGIPKHFKLQLYEPLSPR